MPNPKNELFPSAPSAAGRPPRAPGAVAPPPVHWPHGGAKPLQAKLPPAPPAPGVRPEARAGVASRLPAPPPLPPARPAALQLKRAPHVAAALRREPPPAVGPKTLQAKAGRALGARSAPVVQRMEQEPLVSKVKVREDRVNRSFDVDRVVANSLSSLQTKGWQKTVTQGANHQEYGAFVAVYGKPTGATLTVYIDQFGGDGRINGIYNDGTRDSEASYISFTPKSAKVLEQGYMHSYPQGQGIGTVLSYEAAAWARSQGYTSFKSSLINQNSAKLADTLDQAPADTSCWSCCFLATACIEARGLPPDCAELTVLRGFRDSYMQETAEREALVALYYDIAPRIVAAIHASPDPERELDAIYRTLEECVRSIEAGELDRAFEIYQENVKTLAERFLAP